MPNYRFWIPYLLITGPIAFFVHMPLWAHVLFELGIAFAIPEKPYNKARKG